MANDTVVNIETVTKIISEGKQGPAGASGLGTYVQDTQPVIPLNTKALWVQTGLGVSGNDFTFWIIE